MFRKTSSSVVRLVLASGVAVLAITLPGCSRTNTAQAHGRDEAVKPIKADAVREETIHRSVEVVATLAAQDEAVISSEADGVVRALPADLGDRVHAGQVLVELDREKAQYNFDLMKATLASTLAKYGATSVDQLPPIERTPDVQSAAAQLAQAKQSYDRAAALQKRQLVPQQTLDDADAMLQAKQAGYDSSLQNAKNLRASIDASRANMQLADRQLRDTYIRAPFDGFVQQRLVNLGQYVKGTSTTPQAVMSIVRIDPLKARAEIPEKMAPWINVGEQIELHVDAYPDKTIYGKVSRISPAVNPSTRAFPFEATVPNGNGDLKPGTFARVRIASTKVDHVLTVPVSSLQYRYGVNRAFVVEGDHVSARELKVGDRIGDRIEVVSGIQAGEAVAAGNVETLADGLKVSVSRSIG
jgi:multidrug efflux pump subunit AcrA (membrane-fusion protein)